MDRAASGRRPRSGLRPRSAVRVEVSRLAEPLEDFQSLGVVVGIARLADQFVGRCGPRRVRKEGHEYWQQNKTGAGPAAHDWYLPGLVCHQCNREALPATSDPEM